MKVDTETFSVTGDLFKLRKRQEFMGNLVLSSINLKQVLQQHYFVIISED